MIQRYRYLVLHKPYGVICQFTPTPTNDRTLQDYIRVPAVYPVGRLDQDSEGLLLLTNDGKLQHRLTDPKFQHPKTYWVQVEGIPQPHQIEQLRQGVTLNFKGKLYHTLPAHVEPIEVNIPDRVPPIRYRAHIPTSWLQITIVEGKNRQIRRMTAQVGLPTLRLVRVKIGDLELGDLPPGQWRDLSSVELACLRSASGSMAK
ncbi:MAG: pseudouridine synthase [Pseudanabaenaceae cyanobacterium SKYGB_i_bin29]|nr:pseudouridine synthase [Pseudanabaenaceae cyanobacterium SKYG29]MDW8421591.1 pseudouridine synthase [Pseudanabaenaceae cyanobacterium SKYGB_i_bin29]